MTRDEFLAYAGEAFDAAYQMPEGMGGDWAWAARGTISDGYANRDQAVMDALDNIMAIADAPAPPPTRADTGGSR